MARVSVVVSPGSRGSLLVGRHGESWKVRVAAAPEHGRANDEVRTLLAAAAGVPRASVRIVAGGRSRRKVVEIDRLDAGELDRRLATAVSDVSRKDTAPGPPRASLRFRA